MDHSGTSKGHMASASTFEPKNHLLSRLPRQSAYRTSLEMAQTAACNRLHEAEERLARWLLLMDDRNHNHVLTLTHEFLGAMLGTRRSTVTIASGMLQKAGLIEHRRG